MFEFMVQNWLPVVVSLIFVLAPSIVAGIFIFKRTIVPPAFASSIYVRKLKLKMAVSLAVPITLVWLVLLLCYAVGGYIGLAVGLIVPAYVLIRVLLVLRSHKLPYAIPRDRAPKLHNLFSEVAAEMKIDKEFEIGFTDQVNAYTFGLLKPKVALGIPLFDYLTIAEMRSIVAHELGHVKNHDYAFSTFIVLVNESVRTAFEWGKRLLGIGVNFVHSIIVGLTYAHLGETIATVVGWIGEIFAKIFMGLVTLFLWVWQGFLRLITLLFRRQREFLADLHTTPFESKDKPINFKRGLGKISLLGDAQGKFINEVIETRLQAVEKGKYSASDVYDQPHLFQMYKWMRRAGFELSDKLIDSETVNKKPGIVERLRSLGHDHPLTGDRLRNLETMTVAYPSEKKYPEGVGDKESAKTLVEDIYSDAVSTLYGSSEEETTT